MLLSGGLRLDNVMALSDDDFTPTTDIAWYSSFWAEDPLWAEKPADGVAVTTWRNAGTLGTAATQSTEASQPTYRGSVTALNNRPAVDFDGTDDRLEIVSGVSLAQPFSVVWIGSADVALLAQAFVGLNSGANARRLGLTNGGAVSLNLGAALNSATARSANTGYMVNGYANGASSTTTVNGTADASGNAGASSLDQIIIGAGRTAPSTYANFLNGKTAFLGIFDGDITTSPRWPDFKAWCRIHYNLVIA
jgi:hypothetical protein